MHEQHLISTSQVHITDPPLCSRTTRAAISHHQEKNDSPACVHVQLRGVIRCVHACLHAGLRACLHAWLHVCQCIMLAANIHLRILLDADPDNGTDSKCKQRAGYVQTSFQHYLGTIWAQLGCI